MTILSLHVIHLYEYQKPQGEKCPVEKLKSELNPLELSTCMRHIYIFSSEQLSSKKDTLDEILQGIMKPRPHRKLPFCQYVEGKEAYQLLLFWIIGGLNPKKTFEDARIIGDFRSTCESYKKTASPKYQKAWELNKLPMLALETDGKYLLQLTNKLGHIPLTDRSVMLQDASRNCAWVRSIMPIHLFSPSDYEVFLSKENTTSDMIEYLKVKRANAYKEIAKIEENASDLSFFFSEDPKKLCLDKRINEINRLIDLLVKEQQKPAETGENIEAKHFKVA